MAIYGSDDVGFVILGGYDVRSNITDLTDGAEALLEDTTVLGDSWEQQSFTGVNKFEVSVNGFYDDADNLSNEAFNGNQGSTQVLTWSPAGNTAGQSFRGGVIVEKNFNRVLGRGALHKIAGTLVGSGAVEDGVILKTYAASTGSTGNTHASAYDSGSSSTKGGAGYYQLSTITLDGASSFTVTVRHSADSTTWVDLITFAGSSVAPYGERAQTAASTTPVNRYLAAAWAYASTVANSSRTFTGFVGFVRNR